MKRILHCDWLLERAKWRYFAPFGITRRVQQENSVLLIIIPYNKSFIGEPFSVKMAAYLPRSLCVFMNIDSVSDDKHPKT